jgi:hypothetical protein
VGGGSDLDGPFLRPDGSFGLLVSLRGKDGGSLPSPSELRWSRDVPDSMRSRPVHVFLRIADARRYLGAAKFARDGRPARDGFRVLFSFDEPLDETVWREITSSASAPPPPDPEEAIAALSPNATSSDCVGAMRVFLHRWFGCSLEPALVTTSVNAPVPLVALYGAVEGHAVCVQNRLVPRGDLAVREDGKVVFYIENQGVCDWATEAAGDDPPVFVKQSSHGAEWVLESRHLSSFLIQLVVLEAAFGARFSASHEGVDGASLRKLVRRVKPLPLPDWSSSGTTFFGSGGVVGFAFPNGRDFDVWLGAKTREPFEAIEDLLEDWPEVGF